MERAQLPPWLAVGFGSGIAAWFALNQPGQWAAFLCIAAALALAGFVVGGGRSGRALGWFALTALLGCALVWARAEWIAAPRLVRPVVAEVAGQVESVDHLAARDTVRLTLRTSDSALPPRVRVSVDEDRAPPGLARGSIVRLRARLAPPPPMALPGTYDFARDAWFKGIGAVGKSFGSVAVIRAAAPRGIEQARNGLREHIARRLPDASAGIAIALATGDQNAVGEGDAEAMRRSGLTHLLSVSGLHIAAVVAFAMLLSLKLLAFSERLALRFNLVLVSAAVAAAAGIGYTLLTGAQVPTVRSCIAALLVLLGIALGRDAISIRLIAVGALVVLLVRPESLVGASFQFSFAAVTSIIALHSSRLGRRLFMRGDEGAFRNGVRILLASIATGLAVELALMPFALYHFHKAGLYGVAANLIAIPLTTFVIMPLEAGALILDIAGAGAPLWWLAGHALEFLLWVAHSVANARGAVATLASMPVMAFALMVLGGLWLCLWTSRPRLLGFIPLVIGAAIAVLSPTPDLLVTGDGKHLAIVARDGTPMLLRDRTGDFMRDLMSEASGFDEEPGLLAGAPFGSCSRDACVAAIRRDGREWRLLATRSTTHIDWAPLVRACAQADIVVSERWLPRHCNPRWLKLDRKALERTGGVSVFLGPEPRVDTVGERLGRHPWALTIR